MKLFTVATIELLTGEFLIAETECFKRERKSNLKKAMEGQDVKLPVLPKAELAAEFYMSDELDRITDSEQNQLVETLSYDFRISSRRHGDKILVIVKEVFHKGAAPVEETKIKIA